MKKTTKQLKDQAVILETVKSYSSEDIQELLISRMRLAALELATNLLEDEVKSLCGDKYSRGLDNLRAGSDSGRVVINGQKVAVSKPRVRSRGKNEEVHLDSYAKLRDQDLLDSSISKKMLHGVSCRNYEGVIKEYSDSTGISKSSISRAFNRDSKRILDDFNTKDLSAYQFVAAVIDGVEIKGNMMLICLGITDQMEKIPLGIRLGSSENSEVVKDLLASLKERNFTEACDQILFLLDGSKALSKGVKLVFGDKALIQRCWIHKSRNITSYLPKAFHKKAHIKLKAIIHMNSYSDAKKSYDDYYKWLKGISVEAANSLAEAGEDLLSLHKLKVTGELRKSLASTNMIESLISTVRFKSYRVKNWKNGEQANRWVAFIINDAKTKFKKLRGSKEQGKVLINSLNQNKTIETLAA